MKKKIIIIVVFIILILVVIGVVGVGYFLHSKGDPVPYLDYTYRISGEVTCSCIVFREDNVFSEYDCEDSTSNMSFSGEYYTRYLYDKKNQTITLYSKYKEYTPVILKVMDWTDTDFTFQVVSTPLECDDFCIECSINHKDVYHATNTTSTIYEIVYFYNKDLDEYKWEYKIKDPTIVDFYDDVSDIYIDGSTGLEFKGLNEGKTSITFNYVNRKDGSIKKTVTIPVEFEDLILSMDVDLADSVSDERDKSITSIFRDDYCEDDECEDDECEEDDEE